MLKLNVDDEIELALVHESFCSRYEELAREDYEHLAKWLTWPPFVKSRDDFLRFVRQSLCDYADEKSMMCGILFRGELVGNICFKSIDRTLKKVEIGYWLTSSHQGKGIITRACQKLIGIAFTEMGMEKIEMSVAENNFPSRAVCERLGMTLESIVTNAESLNGQMVNHAIYGLQKVAP